VPGIKTCAYLKIASPRHWFKNGFTVLGVALALFHELDTRVLGALWRRDVAVAATCLVAPNKYVLNELLDAKRDALHPEKRFRPVPSRKIVPALGYVERLVRAAVGLRLAVTNCIVDAVAVVNGPGAHQCGAA
jgi:4-hydroxybenzoate polyprenyltransferase